MTKSPRSQLLQHIGRLEKELLIKKKALAAVQIRRPSPKKSKKPMESDPQKVLARLVKRVGELSSGGNSVEDQRRERERCK